jgi:hypothetical protein
VSKHFFTNLPTKIIIFRKSAFAIAKTLELKKVLKGLFRCECSGSVQQICLAGQSLREERCLKGGNIFSKAAVIANCGRWPCLVSTIHSLAILGHLASVGVRVF